MRRSFSLAGSVEEGAEVEVEVVVVVVVEAAAFAVADAAALGFLGPRAVLDAAPAVGAAASPAPLSAPAAEEEEEETEANCRRAIKASGADDDDDDAFEASQRTDAPAFAAPLAPWSKLVLCFISEGRVWRDATSG